MKIEQEKADSQENTGILSPGFLSVIEISPTDASEIKRMSITLSGDSACWLEKLAESQGISQVEALRKALSTEVYIKQKISSGASILVRNPDNSVCEVVFH